MMRLYRRVHWLRAVQAAAVGYVNGDSANPSLSSRVIHERTNMEQPMDKIKCNLPIPLIVVVMLGTAVLCTAPALGEGNTLRIVNGGGGIEVENFTAREKDGDQTQRLGPVKIPAGGQHDFEFDQLTCAIRQTIRAKPQEGAKFEHSSSQTFVGEDADHPIAVNYPLIFPEAAPIRYELAPTDFPLIGSLPAGAIIEIVDGEDQSGTFPPSVVFVNEDLGTPYSGLAVSNGDVGIQLLVPPIPTVSEWGLIVLFLLLLTAGTIVIRRAMVRPQLATA
jgi:hypothetical protein